MCVLRSHWYPTRVNVTLPSGKILPSEEGVGDDEVLHVGGGAVVQIPHPPGERPEADSRVVHGSQNQHVYGRMIPRLP